MAKTAPAGSAAERLYRYSRIYFETAQDFAAVLGTHHTHLSQIINGKRRPGLALAIKIEDETGIPIRSWQGKPVGRLRSRRRKTRQQPAEKVA